MLSEDSAIARPERKGKCVVITSLNTSHRQDHWSTYPVVMERLKRTGIFCNRWVGMNNNSPRKAGVHDAAESRTGKLLPTGNTMGDLTSK